MKRLLFLTITLLALAFGADAGIREYTSIEIGNRDSRNGWITNPVALLGDVYYLNYFGGGTEPPDSFTGYGGNTSSSFSIVSAEGLITKGTTASKWFEYDYGRWGSRYFKMQVKNFSDGVRVNTFPVFVDVDNYISVFTTGARFSGGYEIGGVFQSLPLGTYFTWSDNDYFSVNVESRGNSVYAIECYQNDFLWTTWFIPYDAALAESSFALGCESADLRIDNLSVTGPIDTIPTKTMTATITPTPTATITVTQTVTPTATISPTFTHSPTATATPAWTSPWDAGATGIFATHRVEGNTRTAEYIMQCNGTVSGVTNIWDWQQNTSNYKTSSGGSWIDGSGETWKVIYWYDQLDNARKFYRSADSNRPRLDLNSKNGYPVMIQQGTNNLAMFNEAATNPSISDYITASTGIAITTQYYDQVSSTKTASATYSLSATSVDDASGYIGIYRGVRSGTDGVYAYNWDGGDDHDHFTYSLLTWYTVTWQHQAGNLYVWNDKNKSTGVSSGNTSSTSVRLHIWVNESIGHKCYTNQLYYFDTGKSDAQAEAVIDYADAH